MQREAGEVISLADHRPFPNEALARVRWASEAPIPNPVGGKRPC